MGVALNFVIFPLSALGAVLIRSSRFHATSGRETRVSVICVAQYIPHDKTLTCKRYNRAKSRVSKERAEADIMSNFLHLKKNWLNARLPCLQVAAGIQISVGPYVYIWLLEFDKTWLT